MNQSVQRPEDQSEGFGRVKVPEYKGVHACVLSGQVWSTLATLWTVDRQAPPSMGFPSQEY